MFVNHQDGKGERELKRERRRVDVTRAHGSLSTKARLRSFPNQGFTAAGSSLARSFDPTIGFETDMMFFSLSARIRGFR